LMMMMMMMMMTIMMTEPNRSIRRATEASDNVSLTKLAQSTD